MGYPDVEQWDKNAFKLPDEFPDFLVLKQKLYDKNWNVYSKKALTGVNSVLGYLGRYTHRVAISNSRIINIENLKKTFKELVESPEDNFEDYIKSDREIVDIEKFHFAMNGQWSENNSDVHKISTESELTNWFAGILP